MPVYETLVTALTGLKARGYTLDFNIAFDSIDCTEHGICLNPSEFEITEVYGIYADAASDEMIKKLTMHHKP